MTVYFVSIEDAMIKSQIQDIHHELNLNCRNSLHLDSAYTVLMETECFVTCVHISFQTMTVQWWHFFSCSSECLTFMWKLNTTQVFQSGNVNI